MSLRTAYVIVCDFPGCAEEYVGTGDEIARNARWRAQGDHWRERRVGRKWFDLCPDHKEAELTP